MAAEVQRSRNGQFAPTEDVAERDAYILRLLAQGMSCQQVVDMRLPGIANSGAVSKARRRALDAIRAPAVAEYRAEQLAKLDALEEGAWEDVRNPGPKTSVTGKVITDGQGEPWSTRRSATPPGRPSSRRSVPGWICSASRPPASA